VIERPIVVLVSLFKGDCCHSDVVLHAGCVACCDSCLVCYVLSLAFFLECMGMRSYSCNCLWQVFPNYACIMSGSELMMDFTLFMQL
jgi:hypothetical protein